MFAGPKDPQVKKAKAGKGQDGNASSHPKAAKSGFRSWFSHSSKQANAGALNITGSHMQTNNKAVEQSPALLRLAQTANAPVAGDMQAAEQESVWDSVDLTRQKQQTAMETAAVRIQRWYRKQQQEKQAAAREVQQYMTSRRRREAREALADEAAAAERDSRRLVQQQRRAVEREAARQQVKQQLEARHRLQRQADEQVAPLAAQVGLSSPELRVGQQSLRALRYSMRLSMDLQRSRHAQHVPVTASLDLQQTMRASFAARFPDHDNGPDDEAPMLTSAEFEDFTRDVAARIIQHYWRLHLQAKAGRAPASDVDEVLALLEGCDHPRLKQERSLPSSRAPCASRRLETDLTGHSMAAADTTSSTGTHKPAVSSDAASCTRQAPAAVECDAEAEAEAALPDLLARYRQPGQQRTERRLDAQHREQQEAATPSQDVLSTALPAQPSQQYMPLAQQQDQQGSASIPQPFRAMPSSHPSQQRPGEDDRPLKQLSSRSSAPSGAYTAISKHVVRDNGHPSQENAAGAASPDFVMLHPHGQHQAATSASRYAASGAEDTSPSPHRAALRRSTQANMPLLNLKPVVQPKVKTSNRSARQTNMRGAENQPAAESVSGRPREPAEQLNRPAAAAHPADSAAHAVLEGSRQQTQQGSRPLSHRQDTNKPSIPAANLQQLTPSPQSPEEAGTSQLPDGAGFAARPAASSGSQPHTRQQEQGTLSGHALATAAEPVTVHDSSRHVREPATSSPEPDLAYGNKAQADLDAPSASSHEPDLAYRSKAQANPDAAAASGPEPSGLEEASDSAKSDPCSAQSSVADPLGRRKDAANADLIHAQPSEASQRLQRLKQSTQMGQLRHSIRRASTEKLTIILQYLDNVEAEAEQEAAAVAAPLQYSARTLSAEPSAASLASHSHSRARCKRDGQDGASVAGSDLHSMTSAGNPTLAAAVYEGVRQRIRGLQAGIEQRDRRLAELQQQLDRAVERQAQAVADAISQQQDAFAQQRHDYEAAIARHLQFADRLLADKAELSTRCAQLAEQLQVQEARGVAQVAALKDSWAGELRRQKEAWTAAEKLRREAWLAEKTKEVKEMTIKGLEPEIQGLMQKHKADLRRAEEQAAEATRAALGEAAAKHEAAVREVRERFMRERDDAVDRERAAAQERLREAAERYEAQMQSQRLRLISDTDLRMEQIEATRREERKRSDEALEQLKREQAQREAQLRADLDSERVKLQRQHERAMRAQKEEFETSQEGWRAAIAERARKELESREALIRQRLAKERDEELEAVMERMEQEVAASREATLQEARAREEAAKAQLAAVQQDLRGCEAQFGKRLQAVAQQQAAAEERAERAQRNLEALQADQAAKASTIVWLEEQMSQLQHEAAAKEAEIRAMFTEKAANQIQATELLKRHHEQLQEQLAAALKANEDLRQRNAVELAHVEGRVRAALAKKDETIHALREQLEATAQQLHSTAAVLEQ